MAHAHDHSHEMARGENRRALAITLALTASFTVAEVFGGLLTGSLALLADAGHMLSDNLSLGVAMFAAWLAGRPETPERSFGYKRAEILAALANGVTLVAISIWIFVEAFSRSRESPEILGGSMLAIAALGLLVNAAGAIALSRSGGDNLNMRGALRHVIADALGSVGTIAAGLTIVLTGWRYADPRPTSQSLKGVETDSPVGGRRRGGVARFGDAGDLYHGPVRVRRESWLAFRGTSATVCGVASEQKA